MRTLHDPVLIDFVMSDAQTPPKRLDETVQMLGGIKVPQIPNWSELPRWKNADEEEFRRFEYELRVVSNGKFLHISVYHDNQRLCSQAVSFDSRSSASASAASTGASQPQMVSVEQVRAQLFSHHIEESNGEHGDEDEDWDFEVGPDDG